MFESLRGRIADALSILALRVSAALDARDYVLAVGLTLLAVGFAQVWTPGAYLVPGAVLTYVAIFGVKTGTE